LTDFWLAYWTQAGEPFGLDTAACIAVYFALTSVQAVGVYVRSCLLQAFAMVAASRNLYSALLRSVLSSPTKFFDTTPTGRLLNRFTADMDIVDNQLKMLSGQTCGITEMLLAIACGILVVNPLVALVILPCFAAYFMLTRRYRPAARDIQRLESITKTPIFNRISETLAGLQTVRALSIEEYLTEMALCDIDDNQACNLFKVQVGTWLAFRLEILSIFITTTFALLSVLPFQMESRSASFVGIAMTYGLEVSRYIQALSKSLTDIEQKFTSVERIFEYCDLPREAAARLPSDDALQNWPAKGAIDFEKVTMRYREGLDPALHGLSFSLEAGQKLGVVGRTGSGKSSIIVALLRLSESEAGHIRIDGQDLQLMGLQKLRLSLAYIPQEPVLFGKTSLRGNLDPFAEIADAEIEQALDQVKMGKENLPQGLETEIQEGGAPFSVGQRQLLCLARAVLRRSKVILMDEATASVDNETDALIQQTIRNSFADSTVLCIAHRIKTIMDSDKILVMGQGACQELGTPGELLANPDSHFRQLAIESNIEVPGLAGSVTSL